MHLHVDVLGGIKGILKAYKRGTIERDTALEYLQDIGYSEDGAWKTIEELLTRMYEELPDINTNLETIIELLKEGNMPLTNEERTARIAQAQADRDAAQKRAWESRDARIRKAQSEFDFIVSELDNELDQEIGRTSDQYHATVDQIERESGWEESSEPAPAAIPEAGAEDAIDREYRLQSNELAEFWELCKRYITGTSLLHDLDDIISERQAVIDREYHDSKQIAVETQHTAETEGGDHEVSQG